MPTARITECTTFAIFRRFTGVCPGIKLIAPENATLLGSALGVAAIPSEMGDKLELITELCKTLDLLPQHAAFFLLKNCFAAPKLMYLFRTAPTFTAPEILAQIESQLRSSAERILNVILDDAKWSQLSLPVRMGGFGLQNPMDLSSSAYLSSVFANREMVRRLLNDVDSEAPIEAAIASWTERSHTEPSSITPKSRQKSWLQPIHVHKLYSLRRDTDEKELARLQGVCCRGSGDWLNALPSSNLGLEMTNDCFRISACLRFGAPVITECFCICGASNDKFGNHALTCPSMRSRHTRHQTCNKVIQEALKSGGIPSSLEPRGLLRDDGKRPDGVSLLPWSRGRVVAWDFTCTHRLAPANARVATGDGPTVAIESEHRKRNHYSALPDYVIMEPVAIETLGGIGASSYDFLRAIGQRILSQTAEPRSFAFLRQRLSVEVNRGNAGCILESINA
jgi:hypothetical protein